ncbi:hypothetical protein ANO14919_057830 [Xylariales sp. No.14919]|nr:hypothetical protein ANO14919_057830 [Xylariales sp. No.14919]
MPYYSNIRSQSSDLGGARDSDESEETITEKIFENGTAIPRKKRRYSLFSLSWLAWIPHIILLAAYSGVLLTWSNFRPHLRSTDYASVPGRSTEHWEARFLGTFSEIGDYFNVSESSDPSPGSQAAWELVQERMRSDTNTALFFFTESLSSTNCARGKEERKLHPNQQSAHRKPQCGGSAGTYPYSQTTLLGELSSAPAIRYTYNSRRKHVLWRRWHGQITDEETAEGIALPVHDGTKIHVYETKVLVSKRSLIMLDHCFEILRYALMCEGDIVIKKVGWTETEEIREGWIDVERFCEDPEVAEGVEAGKKKADMAEASTSNSKPNKGY